MASHVPERRRKHACSPEGMKAAPIVWMVILAAFIVAVGVLPAAGDPVPSGSSTAISIRVSASDTLWSIAAAHKLPGVSTAQMVRIIEQANPPADGVLHAGARLSVPVETAPDTAYAQAEAAAIVP
jgi:Tfp pilus assembly protein FimV